MVSCVPEVQLHSCTTHSPPRPGLQPGAGKTRVQLAEVTTRAGSPWAGSHHTQFRHSSLLRGPSSPGSWDVGVQVGVGVQAGVAADLAEQVWRNTRLSCAPACETLIPLLSAPAPSLPGSQLSHDVLPDVAGLGTNVGGYQRAGDGCSHRLAGDVVHGRQPQSRERVCVLLCRLPPCSVPRCGVL